MSDTSAIDNSHFFFGSILVPTQLKTILSEHEFGVWSDQIDQLLASPQGAAVLTQAQMRWMSKNRRSATAPR